MRELSCKSAYEHEDVVDIDGIIKEFACLKGHSSPFVCNLLYGVTVLPFFAVNSLYLTDNTRDRWAK